MDLGTDKQGHTSLQSQGSPGFLLWQRIFECADQVLLFWSNQKKHHEQELLLLRLVVGAFQAQAGRTPQARPAAPAWMPCTSNSAEAGAMPRPLRK